MGKEQCQDKDPAKQGQLYLPGEFPDKKDEQGKRQNVWQPKGQGRRPEDFIRNPRKCRIQEVIVRIQVRPEGQEGTRMDIVKKSGNLIVDQRNLDCPKPDIDPEQKPEGHKKDLFPFCMPG